MKIDSTPNNERWGVAQTLIPNNVYYEHGELNDIKVANLPSSDIMNTPEASGYSDGDIGSSLQEVKYQGVMNSKKIRNVIGSIAKIGVTAIAAASIFTVVNKAIPKLSDISIIQLDTHVLEYSFCATVEYDATLSVAISCGEREVELETRPLLTGEPNWFSGQCEGIDGNYTLTISYQGTFGGGTIYTRRGAF